jgi:anti-anti-sigma factor
MNIKIRKKGDITILDIEGNIDINASNLIEAVGKVLLNKSKNILCNFEGVNLIDYIGISVIAIAYKNVLNHKGKMKLYNVPSHIKKLFFIVGMDRVLETYESEEQAIESFKEEKIFSQILKKQLRRRFTRIPLKTTIEYKEKFSTIDIFYKGKIMNLSAIGAFVITPKIFSTGDILATRINLLPQPGVVEVDVKVIWIADREIQPLEYPGMGLEFYNINPQKQKQIIEFVEKHLTHTAEG